MLLAAPDAPNFLQLAISNSQFAAGVAKARYNLSQIVLFVLVVKTIISRFFSQKFAAVPALPICC